MNHSGLRAAGRISGAVSFLEASGGGTDIRFTGVLVDGHGSDQTAFGVAVTLVALGLLFGTRLRSEVARRPLQAGGRA